MNSAIEYCAEGLEGASLLQAAIPNTAKAMPGHIDTGERKIFMTDPLLMEGTSRVVVESELILTRAVRPPRAASFSPHVNEVRLTAPMPTSPSGRFRSARRTSDILRACWNRTTE